MKTIKQERVNGIASVVHYPEVSNKTLVILCPGLLDSKDYDHQIALADMLSDRGYTVARFDPTGTWESDGTIADYCSTQYLKDIETVKEFMFSQYDFNHFVIGGHSRGGRLSLVYAATDPEVTAVIAVVASSHSNYPETPSDVDWKKTGTRSDKRNLPGSTEEIEMNLPWSFREDAKKYNALESIKDVNVPVLLISGELDKLVAPADVEGLYNNANEPKKFVNILGIGHEYRYSKEEIDLVNKVIGEWIAAA